MKNKTHDYNEHSAEYAELNIENTFYLAFRDISELISSYHIGKEVLDYGCGAGRSTRFLKKLEFNTIGVDISPDMLKQARKKDKHGKYYIIESGILPFGDRKFDLIFSSFVFLEISTIDEISKVLFEMDRVLKDNGIIIIITSSPVEHTGEWLSFSYDFEENKKRIKSGDTVKLLIKGTNVILHDYYWEEDEYFKAFKKAGLIVDKIHLPMGIENDPYSWIDEKRIPPFSIYILKKHTST